MQEFEPLPKARFSIEIEDGGEWIVTRARRNWFVLPFLTFWLTGWTVGGIVAATTMLVSGDGAERLFMAAWLCLWALGWAFAVSMLGWMIGGRSQIGVRSGALEFRWRMPFVSKVRRYDGRQVKRLRPARASWPWSGGGFMQPDYPPFVPIMSGSVQFDYGGRTVGVMSGLDEAEAQQIVDWLTKRLPQPRM